VSRREGRKAKRQEVIRRYLEEGGNRNTASTQYYYWSQRYDASEAPSSKASEAARTPRFSGEPVLLRVEANGRILIPGELREAMELGDEGKVAARIEDGELRLMAPRVALRRLQEKAKALGVDGRSIIDEFISEKRKEAERE
jgi:bifunctional DNA-binding transcriptional regulator/antitoxin component of YhaV-PrlF toxin-antitoxin module